MVDNIIMEKEKAKMRFFKMQSEKLEYLGEFKENVIIALDRMDIEKNLIRFEIKEAMKNKNAILLKIKRDIKLNLIKPYIDEAEKQGLRYMLVDDLTYRGSVGLVVVTSESLDNESEDIILESSTKVFTDAGLSENFAHAIGEKICSKHYKELEEKLPEYLDKFEKMNIFDKFLGRECIIDRYDEKER